MAEGWDTEGLMESAKAIWEVTAGLIPGRAEPEYTRRFGVTSSEWQQDGLRLLIERGHQATAYAQYLQLLCANGRTCNWVRVDFVWP